MDAAPALRQEMTADEFFAWAESVEASGRYELLNGLPVLMQAERVSHAERKLSATIALRNGLRKAGLDDCHAFIDGVSLRIDDRTVREPDALVHCGPYDGDRMFVSNPVVVVEVVSPSSVLTDNHRKIIDYFAVPSIQHYLIVYGDEARVIHHRRGTDGNVIETTILGSEASIDFSPPGFSVSVEDLLTA